VGLIKDGSIEAALKAFCISGFVHLDIRWRHLGLCGEKVVLLDLGMLNEERDDEKRHNWYDEAIKTQRQRAGLQVNGNETPTMNRRELYK
jgi:hypothetical protein